MPIQMSPTAQVTAPTQGTDRLLYGMILGVLAFWLFAQTTLNIAPVMGAALRVDTNVMNIAVSITALFSGIFIVVVGGLADRIGRVKIVQWGFVLNIVGSLLIGFAPAGHLAATFLMFGRVCEGLSGAFIMPASLALVKAYWAGAARQRAISLWSMGSWGGSGFAALFGGLVAQNLGWRWIFFGSAIVALVGMLLVRGTPESRSRSADADRSGIWGVITFMITLIGLQVIATQGARMGWTSPLTLLLGVASIVAGFLFFRSEVGNSDAFIDFRLFYNPVYAGATLSNFLLNGVTGTMIIAMALLQAGGGMSAQAAGLLTLGYAIAIVVFIRLGEKLLQRVGPRWPMIWGAAIVGCAILLLMPTQLTLQTYRILAIAAFTLFGLGLAIYATPSTDAALSNLPDDLAGSGSGIYKMASSLGASFGVAISAAIFTGLSSDPAPVRWIEGVIEYQGRHDNVGLREAAMMALSANLLMVLGAIGSVWLTIPKGRAELALTTK